MKVKVFAKLNLSLNVYPKTGNFHPVDTLLTSVDLCDFVTVVLRRDSRINVDCANIASQQNTAYRAAQAFKSVFGTDGCDIFVEKHIPIGAGLGGSSADAAAVLHCLAALYGVDKGDVRLQQVCSDVGSDVYFMLFGGFARAVGKGDVVEFGPPPELHFALTTFDKQMSTAEVYAAFDKLTATPVPCDNVLYFALQDNFHHLADTLQNSLQPAVEALSDYARPYLNFCRVNNLSCRMTGSGSAFFVTCKSRLEAEKVADLLNSNGFDTMAVDSLSSGIQQVD